MFQFKSIKFCNGDCDVNDFRNRCIFVETPFLSYATTTTTTTATTTVAAIFYQRIHQLRLNVVLINHETSSFNFNLNSVSTYSYKTLSVYVRFM